MRLRALSVAAAVAVVLGLASVGDAPGSSGSIVHVGQAVRFVNVGKIDHTVADTDARGEIRSRLIKPRPLSRGQVQVVRFKNPGRVPYLCTFHPTLMKGRIIVVR
jgi:plastocyanin